MKNINYDKLENVIVGGIDNKDAMDFSDAYLESAEFEGRELTEEELDDCPSEALYNYTINQVI